MPLSKILFSFQGRLRRSRFWAVRLSVLAIFIVLYGLISAVEYGVRGGGHVTPTRDEMLGVYGAIAGLVIGLPATVAYVWIDLATAVKRLHDQDLSGWFSLLGLIPYAGGLIMFVMLGCLDGTHGRNRFGDSEKYPQSTAEVFT